MIELILAMLFSATVLGGLLFSFGLGLLHGITPDEHTWPITLSYSLGSGSTLGGMAAGFYFSLGFTIQRALLSELSFLFLAPFLLQDAVNGIVYVLVGILMAVAGFYILRFGVNVHLTEVPHFIIEDLRNIYGTVTGKKSKHDHLKHIHDEAEEPRPVPLKFAFVHGLVAGFAFDAFALIVFTTIVAEMPNAWAGWIPGALFGIGTMITQMLVGTIVGFWLQHRKYSMHDITYIGRKTSGMVLAYGGGGFAIVGLLVINFPVLQQISVPTGIPIPNLDQIDVGFVMVMAMLFIVAIPAYIIAVRDVRKLNKNWNAHKKPSI